MRQEVAELKSAIQRWERRVQELERRVHECCALWKKRNGLESVRRRRSRGMGPKAHPAKPGRKAEPTYEKLVQHFRGSPGVTPDKTCKLGIHGKRLQAAWDHDYLLRLLGVQI